MRVIRILAAAAEEAAEAAAWYEKERPDLSSEFGKAASAEEISLLDSVPGARHRDPGPRVRSPLQTPRVLTPSACRVTPRSAAGGRARRATGPLLRSVRQSPPPKEYQEEPPHWRISSARTRIDGGTIKSMSRAVLTFTTSVSLLGSSTGRSAGLAPRRIRSTYDADLR